MPRTELLISDCDGVIVDSEIISHRVLFEALCTFVPAQALGAALEGTFGLTTLSIINLVEKRFDLQLGPDFENDLRGLTEQRVAAEVEPIPYVRETLLAIDLPLAVASNSRRHNVESSLRRAGLFERVAGNIFSADMVASPKPAPDVYLLAAERMGVPPGHCIVIEDSPTGVLAARTAGMRVIGFTGASHIPKGHDQALRELGVSAVMSDMRELQTTLAGMSTPD